MGRAVRNLRQQRRLTQIALSDLSGVHWNYIGGIERAERNPTVESIVRIATALDVRTSDLFRMAEELAP